MHLISEITSIHTSTRYSVSFYSHC